MLCKLDLKDRTLEDAGIMNSEYDSDSSSAPSTSPPQSPTVSSHTLPTTERLLQYFVSAKRSLSSTNYVSRANELVNSSRNLVEEIAVLSARNSFTERAVSEQIDTLYHIRDAASNASNEAGDEFQGTIANLDSANNRLEHTLNALKETIVDASLQRHGSDVASAANVSEDEQNSKSELEGPKNLYDFIDETNHADLQASLRKLIDSFNDSRADLDASTQTFDETLTVITEILSDSDRNGGPSNLTNIYDEPQAPTSSLFRSIEDHAAELAKLLESLVAHYDLCVTALKHTEGGGEAAKRAVQQAEESLPQNLTGGPEESLYLKTVPEPISNKERVEMLRVLENDAQELDDVATEIKDRNRDQEGLYEQLNRLAIDSRSRNQALRQILDMLHEIKDIHLPSHLHAMGTFGASWKRIQTIIQSQTAELTSLSAFYDSFLSGYNKLLREAERREATELHMRKIAEKAGRDLERLYEADRDTRADFMEETGKYLPQGIWAGLMEGGTRWQVREQVSEV